MVKFDIKLPVSIFKEGKYFVAYTPALDLSTSGKSYEEVRRRFNEVVSIFFEELTKKETLNEVLEGLGWQKIKKQWAPPSLISQESASFQLAVK
ncbi:MAG: hypothetical protein HZA25_02150 [Candidatus Niyogibacteria bacterium]|nr:hypothetical protein [Candidatus Niyogibacteria bacterium]